MNESTQISKLGATLTAVAVAAALAACASAPVESDGAVAARARLTQLQSDPSLANRAPLAMQAAGVAVRAAEQPQADEAVAAYRVYMADRKIDIARAQAETRLAEDQRPALREQSEKARLDARTRELAVAKNQTDAARAEEAEQKVATDTARSEANDAKLAAASSQQQASDALVAANDANLAAASSSQRAAEARDEADTANSAAEKSRQRAAELQQQIGVLQAQVTDRGLVVTLGDVLFASGGSALNDGASGNLNKLVAFLDKYPDRTAAIEGYTDSVGSNQDNEALSARRADSVMAYLVEQGIGSDRLTASGKGDASPVADNDSSSGRQQNRRVEVVIDNPSVALR